MIYLIQNSNIISDFLLGFKFFGKKIFFRCDKDSCISIYFIFGIINFIYHLFILLIFNNWYNGSLIF